MIIPLRPTNFLPGTLKNLFYPPERSEYTYFARAKECPFIGGNATVKAAWAADASMLAYGRFGPQRMNDTDLKAILDPAGLNFIKIGGTPGNWNALGTQAIFIFSADFAILAFRGTELDDAVDSVFDTDVALVLEHDYRPSPADSRPALGFLTSVTHLFSPPCFVHQGFQKALKEVWENVRGIVTGYRARNPHAEVLFTGHSLGGALAVLAYSRFADPNFSLYTFGCPRVGDGAFRDRVLSNPGEGVYRIVNFNDAVSHIPLESLLYKQTPGDCLRFDEHGNLNSDGDTFEGDVDALRLAVNLLPANLAGCDLSQIPAPTSVVDHSVARYCMRIWNCL